jgi:hypothetical protein
LAEQLVTIPSAAESSTTNPVGARVNPTYIERTPEMWAVSETDMKGLSGLGVCANAAFSIGAFCLGVTSNIFLNYGGSNSLTQVQGFMLYRGTWISGVASLLFFIAGFSLACFRHSMWDQIKKESRPVQRA